MPLTPTRRATDPFLAREIAREANALENWKREVDRQRFSLHGIDVRPFRARTVRQMLAAAEEARQAGESPRARFLAALNALEQNPEFAAKADRARAHYWRSMADDRVPLTRETAGAALALLGGMDCDAAREALDALAEMLLQAKAA